jgi:Protein of unknown function (DUF4019)
MEIDENAAIGEASAAADAWLEQLDAGEVEASWEATSSLFRQVVDLAHWRESFEKVRSIFGRTLTRELSDVRYTTTVPGAPDGDYVISEYAAELERKKEAVETVVAMREADGGWRVGGYFVR